MNPLPQVVAIVGPTGSGKTNLAMRLAQALNGEIVGIDASQIYQGFDIGTGKATSEQLNGVIHHNLDILSPAESSDAATFSRHTNHLIQSIFSRGRLPILCGGTGLYFRALRDGLCRAPKVPDEIQAQVLSEMDECGVAAMHARLSLVDAKTAERLHFNDRQRIERALSVYRYTGKTLSSWIEEGTFEALSVEWHTIGLRWPTEILKDRIERRVKAMLEQGWADEVQAIVGQGYTEQVRAFSAIGYRLVLDMLEGRLTEEACRAEIIRQTQRYAKRQMTWFRRERNIRWLDCPFEFDTVASDVKAFLEGVRE